MSRPAYGTDRSEPASDLRVAVSPEQVTVAVEGWNSQDLGDPELLLRSLESLRDQTFPVRDCEILLVRDADGPDPAELMASVLPRARVLSIPGFTYYRSKNLAMREARGEFLALADSDVSYDRGWLDAMLAAFRPGLELVAGRTRYARGFLFRTVDLCDGGMVLPQDGFTNGFYSHNVVMRRSLFGRVRFDETLGVSGGGSTEILRAELAARGVRPWFVAAAKCEHQLPPFLTKRLRVGSYHVHCRRSSGSIPGAGLARVPVLAPLLVCSGVLLKTWARVWRRRFELPGKTAAVPAYLGSTAFARAIEAFGACTYAWAPWLLQKRMGWHDVPTVDAESVF
ncbi:MAG: glycosyltransferase family 2 protein [Thermoanaerobaculia bacterium]